MNFPRENYPHKISKLEVALIPTFKSYLFGNIHLLPILKQHSLCAG